MNTKETEMMSKVEFATTTRAVGGELISSSNQATHVGVVRQQTTHCRDAVCSHEGHVWPPLCWPGEGRYGKSSSHYHS